VLRPEDDSDRAIAALNDRISQDPRVRHVLLPIRDGVMLVHKRDASG
jgi:predicted O-methyltransferase YrrM